jgi:hypothetical protein
MKTYHLVTLTPCTLAVFDLTIHSSAGSDDTDISLFYSL